MNKCDLSKPTKREVLSQKLFINSNMAIIDEADLNNHCSILNTYLDALLIDYDLEKGYFANTYEENVETYNYHQKLYNNIEKTVTAYLNEDFNYVITRKQRSILLNALNNLFDSVRPEYKDDEIADLINIIGG